MRWFVPLVCLVSLTGCLSPRDFDEKAWQQETAQQKTADLFAPHRDAQGRFFNPWMPKEFSSWDFWRWVLSRNSMGNPGPDYPLPQLVKPDLAPLRDPSAPPSLTWMGHATYVFQMAGQVLVSDPFFSERAFLPKRLIPPALTPDQLPTGLTVLISHNHYDHLDADSIQALVPKTKLFICPLGLGDFLREHGAKKVIELDWWQTHQVGQVTITSLPMQHWSRRLGMDLNTTLWCAFMLQGAGRTILYGADSGYFNGFAEIGRRFPSIDAALLGVGAHAPRWFMHYAHLNPVEAVQALRDLNAKRLVPTQWGVLKLGDEPASQPVHALRALASQDPWLSQRLSILPVGGRLVLD